MSRRASILSAGVAASIIAGAGTALAAGPVSGSIAGPVTSVKGSVFKVSTSLSPTGTATVQVGSATAIVSQETAAKGDVKNGVCVTAIGTKAKTAIAATRIMLTQPVEGSCANFGGRRRPPAGSGQRPANPPQGQRPPGNGFANFAFANGSVTAVKGSTLTVHGRTGTTTVTVSTKTQLLKTVTVAASAIRLKMCAFVQGTSADKGVTVKAQRVNLSPAGPNGCTFGGRPRSS
jgi:hypothetical protein